MGMSVGFIFAHDVFTQSDRFRAHRIEIRGAHRLTETEILKQAQLARGINIFSANLFLARKRLLAHSWIATAEVSRELPNRIRISIEEHRPVAVIDLGRRFIMNTHGEIFKEKAESDHDPLPVIQGLHYSDIYIPGSRQIPTFKAVMKVLELGSNPQSILPNRVVKEIHVDKEIGLTIYVVDGGAAIRLGYGNYPNKYRRLKQVLSYLGKKDEFKPLHAIDLNNVNRIILYPVRDAQTEGGGKEA